MLIWSSLLENFPLSRCCDMERYPRFANLLRDDFILSFPSGRIDDMPLTVKSHPSGSDIMVQSRPLSVMDSVLSVSMTLDMIVKFPWVLFFSIMLVPSYEMEGNKF